MLARHLAIMGACLFASTALPQEEGTQAILWEQEHYNAMPQEDDLILPMPCGGAMVFRPVATDTAMRSLDDTDFLQGDNSGSPFINGLTRAAVAGAFPVGNEGRAGYYMAKYELSVAQYAALTEPCPPRAPRLRQFTPKTDLSLDELRQAATTYTIWLKQHAPDKLPMRGSAQGFVRLPTDAEWEFAARGGLAVPPADLRLPRFDLAQTERQPEEFIAHGGNNSAAGRLQIIGRRLPNPLGLHDILGNAAEFVEGHFHMLQPGRAHGLSGGWIKRGGDARTPLGEITAARRNEVPPFSPQGNEAFRDRFLGGRFALGAIAIPQDRNWLADMSLSFDRLSAPDEELPSSADMEAMLALLADLSESAPDQRDRQRYQRIREVMQRSQAERNAQRDRALDLIIEAGMSRCYTVVVRIANLKPVLQAEAELVAVIETIELLDDQALLLEAQSNLDRARYRIAEETGRNNSDIERYSALIEQLASDYSARLLNDRVSLLEPRIEHPRRHACLRRLQDDLGARQRAGFVDREAILDGFNELAG